MGAAASFELQKPVDGSDIINSGSLAVARSEICNLRATLGKYAAQAGFSEDLVLDASDLVRGENEEEDFNRCLEEIKHIRRCLRLSTLAQTRRATRRVDPNELQNLKKDEDYGSSGRSDSSDQDSDDESKSNSQKSSPTRK
jgi:hypothetical protein